MAKWGIIAGIALFAALMVATVIPALFPDSVAIAAPFLCSGGQMSTESQTFYPEPGRTVIAHTFYCTDASGTRREVDTFAALAACTGMGFLPAFLVLALTMGRAKLERLSDVTSTPSMGASGRANDASLKERMVELVQARDAGLITEEEFEQKKKAMLDAL